MKPILSYLVKDKLPMTTRKEFQQLMRKQSEAAAMHAAKEDDIVSEYHLSVVLRDDALTAFRGLCRAAKLSNLEQPGRGPTTSEIVSDAILSAWKTQQGQGV